MNGATLASDNRRRENLLPVGACFTSAVTHGPGDARPPFFQPSLGRQLPLGASLPPWRCAVQKIFGSRVACEATCGNRMVDTQRCVLISTRRHLVSESS